MKNDTVSKNEYFQIRFDSWNTLFDLENGEKHDEDLKIRLNMFQFSWRPQLRVR